LRPGWRIEAQVTVSGRRVHGRGVTPGSSGVRTFIVPAFPLPLADLVRLSRALSAGQGEFSDTPRQPCRGGTMDLEDAGAFIRYLVTTEEVEKPDMLASLDVELQVHDHVACALPFEREEGFLRCALTGVRIRAEGAG